MPSSVPDDERQEGMLQVESEMTELVLNGGFAGHLNINTLQLQAADQSQHQEGEWRQV